MVRISISSGFYVIAAVGLLTIPLPWLFALVLASCLHELFHLIALQCFGCHVSAIQIDSFGARIVTEAPAPFIEGCCALAGPLAGVLLLLFREPYPQLALCGMIQTVCNLIPVQPMDGGRALRCFLEMVFDGGNYMPILRGIQVLFGLVFGALAVCFYASGTVKLYWILCVCFLLVLKFIKIPCKRRKQIVQ